MFEVNVASQADGTILQLAADAALLDAPLVIYCSRRTVPRSAALLRGSVWSLASANWRMWSSRTSCSERTRSGSLDVATTRDCPETQASSTVRVGLRNSVAAGQVAFR